jgi:hypothetical protein
MRSLAAWLLCVLVLSGCESEKKPTQYDWTRPCTVEIFYDSTIRSFARSPEELLSGKASSVRLAMVTVQKTPLDSLFSNILTAKKTDFDSFDPQWAVIVKTHDGRVILRCFANYGFNIGILNGEKVVYDHKVMDWLETHVMPTFDLRAPETQKNVSGKSNEE